MMADTVADFLVGRLKEWGISRIYGYPGDGINGITAALRRAGDVASDGMDFVQVRHEEASAFMASAHAKYSGGELGVCLATSGPGAIHLLNGLYDAKMDHQPVLALIGEQSRTAIGGSYYQEVDLQTLFKVVAHEYVRTAAHPAQVRHLVDRAVRIALAERTVTVSSSRTTSRSCPRSRTRPASTPACALPPTSRGRRSYPPRPTSNAPPRS